MSPDSKTRDRATYLREGLLLFGFVLLLVASAASVVIPELDKDPDAEGVKSAAGAGGDLR
jgi:hypothetical protein